MERGRVVTVGEGLTQTLVQCLCTVKLLRDYDIKVTDGQTSAC